MSKIQNEKELVERIVNRDEKALYIFYKRYKKSIFQFINRQLNDIHLAEEVTQDVFLDFIEALRDFHFQSSVKTFLFSIARHKSIDVIRKKKVKKILFSSLPHYVVEGLKTVFVEEEFEKKELSRRIKKVFDGLPNEYEMVLRLKYIEGQKVQAIAEKLKMKFKATESLIFRARKAFVKVFKASM